MFCLRFNSVLLGGPIRHFPLKSNICVTLCSLFVGSLYGYLKQPKPLLFLKAESLQPHIFLRCLNQTGCSLLPWKRELQLQITVYRCSTFLPIIRGCHLLAVIVWEYVSMQSQNACLSTELSQQSQSAI